MDDQRREALFEEYSEVCNNFRLLTEIRFKPLTFLPAATAITAVLSHDSFSMGTCAVSLFGLAITVGIINYNERNDQLYDELVGRAASIERCFGLFDGAFANRPKPWLSIRLLGTDRLVDHRFALSLIYASSIALWLFMFFTPVLALFNREWIYLKLPHFEAANPEDWMRAIAFAAALAVTALAVKFTSEQKQQRQRNMRELAKEAVDLALSTQLPEIAADEIFIDRCARLSNENAEVIRTRAHYYATVGSEILSHYLTLDPREQMASQFVALLTDLPARWLLDCATNRRGAMS